MAAGHRPFVQPGPRPVMLQPGALPPPLPTNCPPGLEYLAMVDRILVQQNVEIAEVLTGIEFANRYLVMDCFGMPVYYAAEESDFCERQCCGPRRGFLLHITNNIGQDVINCRREFRCCAGCCCACADCCRHQLFIEAPPGQRIAQILQQTAASCRTDLAIFDTRGTMQLFIKGTKSFNQVV